MGRAHEVRAASMAKTAAMKSKLYSRYGKELYIAAKSGVPDPDMNQSLKRKIASLKLLIASFIFSLFEIISLR